MDKLASHRFIIIAVAALTLTTACQKKEAPEVEEVRREGAGASSKASPPPQADYDNTLLEGEEGVKNAIRGYNKTVIEANMKSALLGKIRKYAATGVASRAAVFIEERRKEEVVMRSSLTRLFFENISVPAFINYTSEERPMAKVRTSEKWHYDYVDFGGFPVEPMKEMNYTLEYTLGILQSRWVVSKIEELQPPEFKKITPPRALFD